MQVRKLSDAPQRLLQEVDMEAIFDNLCEKCKKHCQEFVHLPCGRGGQHLNSDIEIDALIKEINHNDLLALLTVEKGSTAKVMITLVDLHEPNEIMYTREHVAELLKPVETDYYGRYEFNDLQKMILEDRRLRMNYWTSKITHKPIEKFKNPNLLNINEKVDRNDIKNPYFTLSRILPISLHMEKTKVISTDVTYDKLHFDFKSKYLQSQQDQIVERQIGKDFHRVAGIENAQDNTLAHNTLITRNYNDGRHGGWDNYISYKGTGTASYVKPHQK